MPLLLVVFVVSGALACSGRSTNDDHPGSAGSGNEAGGRNANPSNPDDPANFACTLGDCQPIGERAEPQPGPRCPVEEPAEDSACDEAALECSYGSSLTAYCRSYLKCTDGAWTRPQNRTAQCVQQPATHCLATPQAGTSCTASEVDAFVPCEYAAGVVCYCLGNPVGVAGTTSLWECYGPPRNGGCPETLPNLGDGCSVNGQACHYGLIEQGCHAPYAEVYCFQGAWEATWSTCLL